MLSIKRLTVKGSLIVGLLVLLGCQPVPPNTFSENSLAIDTMDKGQLLGLQQEAFTQHGKKEVNAIRLDALKETALALSAQGALSKRSQEIDTMLEKNRQYLDQIFNFQALVLDHDVLPPVIVEGRQILNLPDDETIRIADQTYRIIVPARFITAAPNWRNYLWLNYSKPEAPDTTLLPRSNQPEELKIWKKHINEGWNHGAEQANGIFAENLARLKRDYQGMALYRKLLNQKMVSAPVVAKTELGVTGGGIELNINDQFKRITEQSGLNPNSDEWAPAVAQPFTGVHGNASNTSKRPGKKPTITPTMHSITP
jgi:defect in organelle trafficking protein DotC